MIVLPISVEWFCPFGTEIMYTKYSSFWCYQLSRLPVNWRVLLLNLRWKSGETRIIWKQLCWICAQAPGRQCRGRVLEWPSQDAKIKSYADKRMGSCCASCLHGILRVLYISDLCFGTRVCICPRELCLCALTAKDDKGMH